MACASQHPICPLATIEDGAARGFELNVGERILEGFVVRRGESVVGYVNICPHAGSQLNWKEDAFLTQKRDYIMCFAHGAMFDIPTGECVAGPCEGLGLTPLPVAVRDGEVVLDASALGAILE